MTFRPRDDVELEHWRRLQAGDGTAARDGRVCAVRAFVILCQRQK